MKMMGMALRDDNDDTHVVSGGNGVGDAGVVGDSDEGDGNSGG